MPNLVRIDISSSWQSFLIRPLTLEWLFHIKNPANLWVENWFALVLEIIAFGFFCQVCAHAKRRGQKETFLVLAAACAVVCLEILPQLPRDGYQLWWYHEGIVNIMRHRLPTYIICICTVVYYYSTLLTQKMNLPVFSQAFVNAVTFLALIFPALWLAPKYLITFYHFDDPVLMDRVAGIPSSQLCVVTLLFFHVGHLFHTIYDNLEDRQIHTQFRVAFQAGLVSACYSIVEFYLLNIIFKFLLKKDLILCLVSALVVLAIMSKKEISVYGVKGYSTDISTTVKSKHLYFIVAFFAVLCCVPLLVAPENLRSTGERLPLGPCDEKQLIGNMSPLEILRRRYICPSDSSKAGVKFDCTPGENISVSNDIKHIYTICGMPLKNSRWLAQQLAMYSLAVLPLFVFVSSFSLQLQKELRRPIMNAKKAD